MTPGSDASMECLWHGKRGQTHKLPTFWECQSEDEFRSALLTAATCPDYERLEK